ncbi:MAG TPA: LysE family transporter [Candidatus Bathyarchaeia archaeon]|nr:LysE family transporter [Candidatus Bathyarchaeia archaeon]
MFAFTVTVVFVTASGALAPGPTFFANITEGAKSGAKSGLAFSVGHTILEFTLVMLLAVTLRTVSNQSLIKLIVGVAGGAALLGFGFFQIRQGATLKQGVQKKENIPSRNPLLLGLIFTGLNPYFIIWWLTAGMPLIENALAIASFAGVFIMYASRVWMDYTWLTSTAYLAKRGTYLTGRKGYKMFMITFGLILVFFGLYFLLAALS